MSTAYYSLIQFCPDAARQEAVNVGVVVFDTASGYVGMKFTPNVDRIRNLFGDGVIDSGQLKLLTASVGQLLERDRELLRTTDGLRALGERQANELRFIPPRRIALGHPQTVLGSLFQRLVERPGKKPKAAGVERKLRREFSRPQFDRLIQRSITVEVESVPVRMPFGYQNGLFHLIRPATFQTDSSDLLKQSGFLQLVGRHIRAERHPVWGELGLVVVGEFVGKRVTDAERHVRRDLEAVQARFYSKAETDKLFADVLAHAKPIVEPAQNELVGADSTA